MNLKRIAFTLSVGFIAGNVMGIVGGFKAALALNTPVVENIRSIPESEHQRKELTKFIRIIQREARADIKSGKRLYSRKR